MKQHSWNVHEENRNPNSQYFHCYDVVDWEGEERPEVFVCVPKVDKTCSLERSEQLAAVTGIVEQQIGCEVETFRMEER
tara:strand:- start:701 stop:937 length:237 start_codon:yes stop_codon:yes gene_type:complete